MGNHVSDWRRSRNVLGCLRDESMILGRVGRWSNWGILLRLHQPAVPICTTHRSELVKLAVSTVHVSMMP